MKFADECGPSGGSCGVEEGYVSNNVVLLFSDSVVRIHSRETLTLFLCELGYVRITTPAPAIIILPSDLRVSCFQMLCPGLDQTKAKTHSHKHENRRYTLFFKIDDGSHDAPQSQHQIVLTSFSLLDLSLKKSRE